MAEDPPTRPEPGHVVEGKTELGRRAGEGGMGMGHIYRADSIVAFVIDRRATGLGGCVVTP
jgi:hypothetical protein